MFCLCSMMILLIQYDGYDAIGLDINTEPLALLYAGQVFFVGVHLFPTQPDSSRLRWRAARERRDPAGFESAWIRA